ncbi:MAG: hypothetical protein A2V70_18865 [Planctomycetes bacterium RBG_13_63_9]|nr:MAG: hypothetical protein A2V70_18865 [Planctomycetes bacterium RBG_13_63_9]
MDIHQCTPEEGTKSQVQTDGMQGGLHFLAFRVCQIHSLAAFQQRQRPGLVLPSWTWYTIWRVDSEMEWVYESFVPSRLTQDGERHA